VPAGRSASCWDLARPRGRAPGDRVLHPRNRLGRPGVLTAVDVRRRPGRPSCTTPPGSRIGGVVGQQLLLDGRPEPDAVPRCCCAPPAKIGGARRVAGAGRGRCPPKGNRGDWSTRLVPCRNVGSSFHPGPFHHSAAGVVRADRHRVAAPGRTDESYAPRFVRRRRSGISTCGTLAASRWPGAVRGRRGRPRHPRCRCCAQSRTGVQRGRWWPSGVSQPGAGSGRRRTAWRRLIGEHSEGRGARLADRRPHPCGRAKRPAGRCSARVRQRGSCPSEFRANRIPGI